MMVMTEKRFTLIDGVKKGTPTGIWDNRKQHNHGTGDELWVGEVVAMLNEGVMFVDENEQLKSALKELKEIGDYQAHRIEELTNENIKLEEQLRNLRRLANELYMEESE